MQAFHFWSLTFIWHTNSVRTYNIIHFVDKKNIMTCHPREMYIHRFKNLLFWKIALLDSGRTFIVLWRQSCKEKTFYDPRARARTHAHTHTHTHTHIGLIEFDIIKVSRQYSPSPSSEIITDSGVPLHSCLRYTCIRSYLLVQIYSFVSKRRKIPSDEGTSWEEKRKKRRICRREVK